MTAATPIPPSLDGKTVVVVGLAQTGVAVAKFCARRGARVVVSDAKPAAQLAAPMQQLEGVPVRFELGGMDLSTYLAAELIVMSPGVPSLPETRAARAQGIEVIAEIELAYRFLHPGARGADITPERSAIALRREGAAENYPVSDLDIVGNHNLENAMCAYLAARDVGISIDAVRAGARAYRPLPHRMELVGDKAGIYFYDDSKGTNVASVAASVRGFPRPLVLIAGGVDKGGSYAPMLEALDGVCKGMVLIGQAAPLIRAAAAEHRAGYPVIDAGDMHDAVRRATELCTTGDAVVLSPACASYDMFQNFGHRGRVFREAVAAVGAKRLDT
jgi:UDP-N-acetylmuramoylalanine-D-glutamate ligase